MTRDVPQVNRLHPPRRKTVHVALGQANIDTRVILLPPPRFISSNSMNTPVRLDKGPPHRTGSGKRRSRRRTVSRHRQSYKRALYSRRSKRSHSDLTQRSRTYRPRWAVRQSFVSANRCTVKSKSYIAYMLRLGGNSGRGAAVVRGLAVCCRGRRHHVPGHYFGFTRLPGSRWLRTRTIQRAAGQKSLPLRLLLDVRGRRRRPILTATGRCRCHRTTLLGDTVWRSNAASSEPDSSPYLTL